MSASQGECQRSPKVLKTPVGLDPFVYKQFDDPCFSGTRVSNPNYPKETFLQKVNEIIRTQNVQLVDGYADFCKHIFVSNFVGAKVAVLPITAQNRHLLRSGYVSRRAEELPVLSRWFLSNDVREEVVTAKHLDLILYSREQIAKESAAMEKHTDKPKTAVSATKTTDLTSHSMRVGETVEAPLWSIISIKAQNEDYELPMAPITMMRNALISEGGSGVEINRQEYAKSVDYWRRYAVIMDKTKDDDAE